MRYRALDANGDFTFGQGSLDYLVNSPATVAQAILTRLLLLQGEWFLDTTAGMTWLTQVIGVNTSGLYDNAIKNRILGTQGVDTNVGITLYSSSLIGTTLTVEALEVGTIYGDKATLSNVILAPAMGYGVGGYGLHPYGE